MENLETQPPRIRFKELEGEKGCQHLIQHVEEGRDGCLYQHCKACKRMLYVR